MTIDDKELIKQQTQHLTVDQLYEWFKCRSSFAYWCMNYAYIEDATGTPIKIGESDRWTMQGSKYLASAKLIDAGVPLLVVGSRQMGKSILQQLLLAHRLTFYPSAILVFITIDNVRAVDAVLRINTILNHNPSWLKVPSVNKVQNATFISLQNKSKLLTFTVSGNKKATDVARGLATYTISIDESAFIRDFNDMYMSLAPAFSSASKSAREAGLTPSMILTTTPNGTMNAFYNFWSNGLELGEVYDFKNNRLKEDWRKTLDGSDNGFVKILYHWSDIYDEKWYDEQKKLLNNNRISILQELDCKFLGNSNSIFNVDTLMKLVPVGAIWSYEMSFGYSMNFHRVLKSDEVINRKLMMGIDVAGTSTDNSDYSTIVLIDIYTKETIAEFKHRTGIIRNFVTVIRELIEYLIGYRFILDYSQLFLAIENNSYGKSVIEQLLYEETPYEHPYDEMIIRTSTSKPVEELKETIRPKKKQKKSIHDEVIWHYGINTNTKTRPVMMNDLISQVNEHPETIVLPKLIEELHTLVQTQTGKIEASKNAHDDVVMAYALSLYGIKQLLVQGRLYLEDSKDVRFKSNEREIETAINSVFTDKEDVEDRDELIEKLIEEQRTRNNPERKNTPNTNDLESDERLMDFILNPFAS